MNTKVLILCPPNMTAPMNGPKGIVGDRIHQLPAVQEATSLFSEVFVWPEDAITRQVFQFLPKKFLQGKLPSEVVKEALELGINQLIGLYANPTTCLPSRMADCEMVLKCDEIAQEMKRSGASISIPIHLNPKGRIPLWRELLSTVRPQSKMDLLWPTVPFFRPSPEVCLWAEQYVDGIAEKRPVLVVSPLSGSPKGVVDNQWWCELAQLFGYGKLIVPVHEREIKKAEEIFNGLPNVGIIGADLAQTAALASLHNTHVIGIDGGIMNVLAAAKVTGVMGIYGEWPASAWAMPNVVVRDSDITPEEAIMTVP